MGETGEWDTELDAQVRQAFEAIWNVIGQQGYPLPPFSELIARTTSFLESAASQQGERPGIDIERFLRILLQLKGLRGPATAAQVHQKLGPGKGRLTTTRYHLDFAVDVLRIVQRRASLRTSTYPTYALLRIGIETPDALRIKVSAVDGLQSTGVLDFHPYLPGLAHHYRRIALSAPSLPIPTDPARVIQRPLRMRAPKDATSAKRKRS